MSTDYGHKCLTLFSCSPCSTKIGSKAVPAAMEWLKVQKMAQFGEKLLFCLRMGKEYMPSWEFLTQRLAHIRIDLK